MCCHQRNLIIQSLNTNDLIIQSLNTNDLPCARVCCVPMVSSLPRLVGLLKGEERNAAQFASAYKYSPLRMSKPLCASS